jgi:hypothetical protein
LREPVFSTRPSIPFYHLMRTYTRRFATMGRDRKRRGVFGRRNHQQRLMFPGYTFGPSSAKPILKALLVWAWLELSEGWRTWFAAAPSPVEQPSAASPMPASAVS